MHADFAQQARHGAEHQQTADGRRRSAPVAIDPIAEQAQAEHGHETAEQSPSGGQPALQHPAEQGAHHGDAQVDAGPGTTGHHLARRQNQSLRRVVHGSIGRMLDDVHAFEVHPHGMGGVGEAARSESIRRQEIAELVGDDGLADGQHGQEESARGQGGGAGEEDGQGSPARQVAEDAPRGGESGYGLLTRAAPISESGQDQQRQRFDRIGPVPDGENEQAA